MPGCRWTSSGRSSRCGGHAAAHLPGADQAGLAPARVADQLDWPGNLWMGVSVENRRRCPGSTTCARCPAAVRFMSCEPLLGPLDGLDLDGIDWVIAGGESGPQHRPMEKNGCSESATLRGCGVAFFFKQWGGRTPRRGGACLRARRGTRCPTRQRFNSAAYEARIGGVSPLSRIRFRRTSAVHERPP